jgi:two-component system, NarL family, sensor histidine kinase UhpB
MRRRKGIHILVVEDQDADVELLDHLLKESGLVYRLKRVETREGFLQELQKSPPDLILSDYSLPSFDGLSALQLSRKENPGIPFIFVTGTLGEEVAIETLKSGATDYILKTRLSRLVPAVHRALREARERAERQKAEGKLRQYHEQLRALSVYLQYVREEERARLARAVHDQLGQALTGLKLDLSQLASQLPPTSSKLLKKARSMSAHIDATIQEVRRISTELRPGILDDLGLIAAIEWQASEFQKRTGIRCRVHVDAKHQEFDRELTTAFFRILQETLTNVIRHAKAGVVDIRFQEEAGRLVLEVRDNGQGMSESQLTNVHSLGLLGMRERAVLLGGDFHIEGAPGKGTTVRVSIPLRHLRGGGTHENSHRRRSRRRSSGLEADSRKRI